MHVAFQIQRFWRQETEIFIERFFSHHKIFAGLKEVKGEGRGVCAQAMIAELSFLAIATIIACVQTITKL